MRTLVSLALALLALGCASAEQQASTERETAAAAAVQGPVVSTVEVVNTSGDPVTVTARVGASAEQQLGFLAPGESSIFRIPSGASASDALVLRARGQDGREANTTLQLGGTEQLRWEVPTLP